MVSAGERKAGFTLLELVVACAIGLVIVTLAIFIGKTGMKRAEKAKCISQMRVIHASFTGYLSDHGHWPQVLEGVDGKLSEDKFFEFWVTSLEPHGSSQETWICPSDKIFREWRDTEGQYFGSYIPTPFDKMPSTPLRWNQPWVIERGDMHGKGAHMLMPDGSIQESQNPFHGR